MAMDSSAIIWGEPFVIVGLTRWARYQRWRAEWPACVKNGQCLSVEYGPKDLGESQGIYLPIIVGGTQSVTISLEAQLEGRIVADSITFVVPDSVGPTRESTSRILQ